VRLVRLVRLEGLEDHFFQVYLGNLEGLVDLEDLELFLEDNHVQVCSVLVDFGDHNVVDGENMNHNMKYRLIPLSVHVF